MQKEIKQIWQFDQSPEEVWEYLTWPELLEQWFVKMDFQPIMGHKFQVVGGTGCCNDCEVLEVIPFSRLSYSWNFASAKDQKHYDSKVVWTLVPKENGTELQLVHDGFIELVDLNAHNNGWTTLVKLLAERLNTVKNESTNA